MDEPAQNHERLYFVKGERPGVVRDPFNGHCEVDDRGTLGPDINRGVRLVSLARNRGGSTDQRQRGGARPDRDTPLFRSGSGRLDF
jgi:hypothetical protein